FIMRKIIAVLSIIALISFFSVPAMAFLDDNSVNQTNQVGDANADADATSSTSQGQSIDDHSIHEAMDRSFPVPGNVKYGPVINYYGKPLPTSQFRPVESLLMYATLFNESALISIVKKGQKVLHELEVVNGPSNVARAKYDEGEVRWIRIIATTKVQADHKVIGYVTSEAENRKTSMVEVMAQAALDALEEGADVLQIVAQGASRDTMASGWGIGFSSTQATMGSGNSGTGGANTSVFGLGYSSTQAMMRDKPWIQANALKAPKKVTKKK
ncbi:hypothetical protein KAR91_11285, partial [Candidatus Pacearchaeota archaeon]|nr:hypothetical protein [Candidatus Pacearchaeota archaeon]